MDVRPHSPVVVTLRLCLYALFAGLLALAALRADGPATVAAALGTGAVFALGALSPAVRRSRRRSAVWLAVLSAAWLVLLAFSPQAVWAAFPLYFLHLHLLPARWGLPAVAATAAAAIAGFTGHGEHLSPGVFIGPLLGAAVAVATVLGYEALYRESERRRELIEELVATRAELAGAERAAGTLAERERLAREIHDTLAQGLSSIQLLLRAAQRGIPGDSPAAAHIEQARATAQDNLAEARRFVRALTPPDLEHGSLTGALERLCSRAAGPPAVRFSVSGTPTGLPTPYEVALLRIAQSALGNTLRHARAARAEVTLSFMDTAVALDVVDDGVGFTPDAVAAAGAEAGAVRTAGGVRTTGAAGARGTAGAAGGASPARDGGAAAGGGAYPATGGRSAAHDTQADGGAAEGDGAAAGDAAPSQRTAADCGTAESDGAAAGGGFGLPAMRSRAEALGGTFAVESAPGQGTAVAVTLPYPAARGAGGGA
ncbi:histidine kinase [Streptomyces sp. NRRL S-340]|uniref:histidine kinase n=1 Tax=Streptomyces sp. NRRL S-340 TaxID=1463901 RepID=UPI00055D6278|nr:histidine kinase [Streptomyces sp. NRRL S-340]